MPRYKQRRLNAAGEPMTEQAAINSVLEPATIASLTTDLRALGVHKGMTLMVHSSLSKLGYVVSGAHSVILALEAAIGESGTLVMPTHSTELSDPGHWHSPPVPREWWGTIRQNMPAFDVNLTTTRSMGVIPETFRKQTGTLRSLHPKLSFAARGPQAEFITANHALRPSLGEQSPLARIYDLEGWVLLLGVGHGNNTSLHLAEARAKLPRQQTMCEGSPMLVNGARQWVEYEDIDWDEGDFERLGEDLARETQIETVGRVAGAAARLMPQRALVNFGMQWLERNRR